MKQVIKTPEILQRLRTAVGSDVDLNQLAVYEAIALNTLPLRKRHPLFNKTVVDRSMLSEMAASLSKETLPVQIQHEKDDLPTGRVFYGEVVDEGTTSELRVLFFIDQTEEDIIRKIDAGTTDQVSVSVVSKHIYNSVSGFDYMGPEATFEHVMTGADPDGNILGENGCYGRMVGLDVWFEMSLVGKGGAQNARIVSRDQTHFGSSSYQRLAASGMDPNVYVLAATSTRKEPMDLTTLVANLTDVKVELAQKVSAIALLNATVVAKDEQLAALTAQLADASRDDDTVAAELATTKAALEAATSEAAANLTVLKTLATKVLSAAGKVDETLPDSAAELEALINNTTSALGAVLTAGGKSKRSEDDVESKKTPVNLAAFRVRK